MHGHPLFGLGRVLYLTDQVHFNAIGQLFDQVDGDTGEIFFNDVFVSMDESSRLTNDAVWESVS